MTKSDLAGQVFATLEASLGAKGQPAPAFAALSELYRSHVGFKMLTLLRYDRARGVGRRIFSTNPSTHPAGSDKTIPDTEWVDIVLNRQEVFVANRVEDFRRHYSDWELLASLGLRSGVNFPIVVDGETIGTVNLTEDENYYTPPRIEAGRVLAGPALLVLLLSEHLERAGSSP